MEKFSIDFGALNQTINAPKKIKLAEVQNQIEKVGFGVVRLQNPNNKTNLWKIEDDCIVAMYEDEDNLEKTASVKNEWAIETDRLEKNATIFYKNTPITSIAFVDMGIPQEEAPLMKRLLPERLANNKQLVKLMINSLDESYKSKIVSMYPELK